jgi:nicotinate-nucleotide adenylyltransferase
MISALEWFMTVKTVAVLGTAADPPTIAHAQLMSLARPHFDEVWVMPTFQHMFGKVMTDPYHRVRMCSLMAENLGPWAKASDFEVKHQLQLPTMGVFTKLNEAYLNHQFHLMIGMDNALKIEKWAGYPALLDVVPFVVFDRTGYTRGDEWWHKPPHRYISGANLQVSSTDFRRLYKAHDKEAAKLVAYDSYLYIQANTLY